jgi:hypothetical protein
VRGSLSLSLLVSMSSMVVARGAGAAEAIEARAKVERAMAESILERKGAGLVEERKGRLLGESGGGECKRAMSGFVDQLYTSGKVSAPPTPARWSSLDQTEGREMPDGPRGVLSLVSLCFSRSEDVQADGPGKPTSD